jgi:glycolate oxidase FAD binding subunit
MPARPVLYLRLRGAVAAVDAAIRRLLAQVPGERVDSPETLADWTAARDLRLPWFSRRLARGQDLWRLSVPQTGAPLGVGDTMIDWLGGQRWVWADAGDAAAAQSFSFRRWRRGRACERCFAPPRTLVAVPRFRSASRRRWTAFTRSSSESLIRPGVFNPGRLGF